MFKVDEPNAFWEKVFLSLEVKIEVSGKQLLLSFDFWRSQSFSVLPQILWSDVTTGRYSDRKSLRRKTRRTEKEKRDVHHEQHSL